jgi:hypothetical protein
LARSSCSSRARRAALSVTLGVFWFCRLPVILRLKLSYPTPSFFISFLYSCRLCWAPRLACALPLWQGRALEAQARSRAGHRRLRKLTEA